MDPLSVFFLLIPIGLAVGIFAAITGLGGGVLMVPIIYLGIFLLTNPAVPDHLKYATTISSTVIIFTAISGTIAFSIQKRIDYLVGVLCAPFTITGAYLGKYTQAIIDETYVLIFFAILLFLTAVRMYYKVINSRRKAKQAANSAAAKEQSDELSSTNKAEEHKEEPNRFLKALDKMTLKRVVSDRSDQEWRYAARLYLTPLAIVGGFVASMAGVGGGIVMVPILHIIIGLPIHFSTATSVFIMIFTKTTTVITSYTNSNIVTEGIWWPYVAGLAIGIVAGAQIGARVARKIKADPLKIIFATVIVLVSIWTLVNWRLGITG